MTYLCNMERKKAISEFLQGGSNWTIGNFDDGEGSTVWVLKHKKEAKGFCLKKNELCELINKIVKNEKQEN